MTSINYFFFFLDLLGLYYLINYIIILGKIKPTMQKCMSKSEVRCASLMNNVLEENIDINEILEKIRSFEQFVSL